MTEDDAIHAKAVGMIAAKWPLNVYMSHSDINSIGEILVQTASAQIGSNREIVLERERVKRIVDLAKRSGATMVEIEAAIRGAD